MKILVLGASGATGKLVVSKLLEKNISVRIVIRESATISDNITEDKNIEIVKGNIDSFSTGQIREIILDCDSVVCCLGHNISFKGLFGHPQKLVANAVKKITAAIASCDSAKKLILMSTTAYTNKNQGEKNPFGEELILSVLKIVLPPHKDNILAGDHLVYDVGESEKIEWIAVRPDSLCDEESKSEYEIHENKIRSPIFNAGRTSRINVGHFMVNLLVNESLWEEWKYKTPVIYNKEQNQQIKP
ncbi:MAG TPA: NAD(P)H-binding protein [Bacteroidales bacterium]|nr:NAD(P)H-binding protein [Bacteroidales bacterium]